LQNVSFVLTIYRNYCRRLGVTSAEVACEEGMSCTSIWPRRKRWRTRFIVSSQCREAWCWYFA